MAKSLKTRASKLGYVSQNQLTIEGFPTPFGQHLNPDNRWVRLSKLINWDSIVGDYNKKLKNQQIGASSINPRVVIGSLIIKHHCNLSDEETVMQIQENVYMQYFLGFFTAFWYSLPDPMQVAVSYLPLDSRVLLAASSLRHSTEHVFVHLEGYFDFC